MADVDRPTMPTRRPSGRAEYRRVRRMEDGSFVEIESDKSEQANTPPTISLHGHGLGVIILRSTGVRYEVAAGGHAHICVSAEGAFVPLHGSIDVLSDFFRGPNWKCWCCDGIDDLTADFLDNLFRTSFDGELNFLTVDRARMKESQHSWIYANVGEETEIISKSLSRCRGILTWDNEC
jgi:hypothetical protein